MAITVQPLGNALLQQQQRDSSAASAARLRDLGELAALDDGLIVQVREEAEVSRSID